MSPPADISLNRPPEFLRSEAFAEDLFDEVASGADRRRTPRWMGVLPLLPVLVALAGLAFAVLPPA